MKKLVTLLAAFSVTVIGCTSGKSPDGTSLRVVKHKKHSANCKAKDHKHSSQALVDAELGS